MTVFISYARKDRELVDVLARDIARAKQQVWLDHDLTGGQDWWDTILAQIRDCRVFIFVLTPHSIRSKACLAELGYASDLARPIVPVMVRDVAVQLAPQTIARAQVVDYRQRNADAAVDLVNAIVSAPSTGPLPEPLPDPPTLPASYASSVREQIGADILTLQQQGAILMELKAHWGDAEEHGIVLELLHDLRHRSDITEIVAKEIDDVLADQTLVPHATRGEREAVADLGATHATDWQPELSGDGSDAENDAEIDAGQVAPSAADAEGATDGQIGRGIEPRGRRTRSVVILAVLGVVAALAVAAMIALTRGGGDSDELDVESAERNVQAIIDQTEFDETGFATLSDCPLGDFGDLAATVDDAVPLSTATLEGDTFFEARNDPDDVPRIYCGIDASDRANTEGIWGFTAHSIRSTAQEYQPILDDFGAEEWGDYRNGRIVQLEETEDGGERLCSSFWLSDDAALVFAVELYGDGCSLEASSRALEAVLPAIVASLA